jgi:hypothetical protein
MRQNDSAPGGKDSWNGLLKGGSQILGMKPEGSRLALIEDAAIGCDQIHAVRPSCIGRLHLVVKAIDDGGKFDAQFAHTRAGHRGALFLVAGAAEHHFILDIALHLPYVRGMSLQDIDRIKINLALVLVGQFVECGNLPPKGRSGITPKNQDDGLLCPKRSQS